MEKSDQNPAALSNAITAAAAAVRRNARRREFLQQRDDGMKAASKA
jgi:hypothetical protein